MKLSSKDYKNFTKALKKINDSAGNAMEQYIAANGIDDVDSLVRYGYGVSSVYGNASASLAAAMYDEIVSLENKVFPAAELADNPEFGEVAQAIQGTLKQSVNAREVSGAVSRLVKRTGQDTLIKNGMRDGAEFAWVPIGDTCPLCKTIASRGWQPISKKALKKGHAEHIHANCDCSYMIRHDSNFNVAGYDPEKYLEEYENAEGKTSAEKINSMRRMQYAERKDVINAQKRAAYALRKGVAEEGHRGKDRSKEIARSIIESPNYGRRLSALDTNSAVTKNIIKESRNILEHRNGTEFEDLMFIDIRSGNYLVRTDYDVARRAMPSKKMMKMVSDSPDYSIAVLHNHSGSTVPSPADIKSLVDRKNAYGVILGHDGSIYKYSSAEFNAPIYMAAVDKLDKIGYTEASIKTFLLEAKNAGVLVEVL